MFGVALLFCVIGSIFAQVPGFGSCPKIPTTGSLNVTQFTGTWYENQRSVPNLFERETKCGRVVYNEQNTNEMEVTKYMYSVSTGEEFKLSGTAVPDKKECDGVNSYCNKFVFVVMNIEQLEWPYWVVATDYTSYAIVYSCKDLWGTHIKNLWIYTREQKPSESVLDVVNNVVVNHELNYLPTVAVEQNCQ